MDELKLTQFETTHLPRAYVNSSVRFHHMFTEEERLKAAKEAGWNVFQFPSEMLLGGDLLSDSGTTTLTSEQIASMFLGDEAYGSNYGYFQLLQAFEETFGIPRKESEVFLFHQGRAAEHALFTLIGQWGKDLVIPNNGHFDTTRANIEANSMKAVDYFIPELKDKAFHPFKGNMNLMALEKLFQEKGKFIPLVMMTITNNTGGGQPVSLQNLRAVRKICDQWGKPLFLDACRFAENAWFIKNREEDFSHQSILEIIHQTFDWCDGFTISLKKDGLSNMGGALLIRRNAPFLKKHPNFLNEIRDHQILVEGHPTYGGMSGRDIMVAAEGLRTVVSEEYLKSRIKLVHEFGEYLKGHGIPVLTPFGGHAIYIDINEFFRDTPHQPEDFAGIALTALLLLKGVRLVELGAFAFGRWDKKLKKEIAPAHNFIRAAIPRNKYEREDLLYVADCIIELYKKRQDIPRAVPIHGRELSLRHFKARFKLEPVRNVALEWPISRVHRALGRIRALKKIPNRK